MSAADVLFDDALARAKAAHPEVNVDLLLQTLAHIEAHQELWRQIDWVSTTACGTAYCFAGWALTLAGHALEPGREYDTVRLDGESVRGSATTMGQVAPIAIRAAKVLGIPTNGPQYFGVGHPLFDPGNDLDDLRHHIEELTGLDLDDRVVSVE